MNVRITINPSNGHLTVSEAPGEHALAVAIGGQVVDDAYAQELYAAIEQEQRAVGELATRKHHTNKVVRRILQRYPGLPSGHAPPGGIAPALGD